MIPCARVYTTVLLAGAEIVLAQGAAPRYLPSRQIILEYRPANAVVVAEAQLWVSSDSGRTWQEVAASGGGDRALSYSAPADGKYDFYVVLRNAAGTSAETPRPGSTSAATVVVDTSPPLLQIHAAEIESGDDGRPTVALKATVIEENLSDGGMRVFYRSRSQDWIDGGPALLAADRIIWSPPQSAAPSIDLRVIATDLAGNRGSSEVVDVAIPPPCETAPAASAATPQTGLPAGIHPVEPPQVTPVAVSVVEPVSVVRETPPTDTADLQHLRSLATRFMNEGRYSLAAARFEDALQSSPQDADLLVDLGSALYRIGHYDDASTRFQSALDGLPGHIGAIEGLALVAATQKRYPQAREHLQHLLRLLPQSGTNWLRYGDVEHRLGNTKKALEAWERVLNVDHADKELREKAHRRLDYFSSGRTTGNAPWAVDDRWQKPQQPRRSSSSTETKSTGKQPP